MYCASSQYFNQFAVVPGCIYNMMCLFHQEWVVPAETKAKYDKYFEGIDKDKDGLVSGDEARGLFMASNLSSNILAHVW